MIQQDQPSYQLAIRDFQHARKQAVMQQLLARFRGDGANSSPSMRLASSSIPQVK